MLPTEISPLADLVTTSLAAFPSEPGAPLGHKGISARGSAAKEAAGRSHKTKSRVVGFIAIRPAVWSRSPPGRPSTGNRGPGTGRSVFCDPDRADAESSRADRGRGRGRPRG